MDIDIDIETNKRFRFTTDGGKKKKREQFLFVIFFLMLISTKLNCYDLLITTTCAVPL